MFAEFKDFLTLTLAKRLASPFVSTFIFSFLVTNYDITLIVFSSVPWDSKVSFISDSMSNIWGSQWNRVYVPLLFTGFYIFVWPKLDRLIYEYTKREQIKYRTLQVRLEDETPLTRQEETELKRSIREERARLDDSINKRDLKIDQLNREVSSLEAEVIEKNNELSSKVQEIENLVIQIDEMENYSGINKNNGDLDSEADDSSSKVQTKVNTDIKFDLGTRETLMLEVATFLSSEGFKLQSDSWTAFDTELLKATYTSRLNNLLVWTVQTVTRDLLSKLDKTTNSISSAVLALIYGLDEVIFSAVSHLKITDVHQQSLKDFLYYFGSVKNTHQDNYTASHSKLNFLLYVAETVLANFGDDKPDDLDSFKYVLDADEYLAGLCYVVACYFQVKLRDKAITVGSPKTQSSIVVRNMFNVFEKSIEFRNFDRNSKVLARKFFNLVEA